MKKRKKGHIRREWIWKFYFQIYIFFIFNPALICFCPWGWDMLEQWISCWCEINWDQLPNQPFKKMWFLWFAKRCFIKSPDSKYFFSPKVFAQLYQTDLAQLYYLLNQLVNINQGNILGLGTKNWFSVHLSFESHSTYSPFSLCCMHAFPPPSEMPKSCSEAQLIFISNPIC